MLTRFRLGEFDEPPSRAAAVDESLIDSPQHRALAREAAAASAVLAHNSCGNSNSNRQTVGAAAEALEGTMTDIFNPKTKR